MRLSTSFLLVLATCIPASGEDFIAIKPGLMCRSPDALAKLTLPDGSSRTKKSNTSSGDLALKKAGACIDVAIGLRVSVVTARHNTSVVTYAPAGERATTYVIPNIDFRTAPSIRVAQLKADNSVTGKIDQVVSAPGGTNYYIRTVPGNNADGDPNMEIEVTYHGNTPRAVLLKSQMSGYPRDNLTDFRNLSLSPDNKTLYFETAAYATENAIHAIDLASNKLAFIASGELACVVLAGRFQGDLIVQQHRYFVQGGSYDNLWLIDPKGREIGLVSEDTDASKVCPTLSN